MRGCEFPRSRDGALSPRRGQLFRARALPHWMSSPRSVPFPRVPLGPGYPAPPPSPAYPPLPPPLPPH
eukprot:8772478-Pyramimonas_sp.AAC.1